MMSDQDGEPKNLNVIRSTRVKLSRDEVIRRMQAFPERECHFIASVRNRKSVSILIDDVRMS